MSLELWKLLGVEADDLYYLVRQRMWVIGMLIMSYGSIGTTLLE